MANLAALKDKIKNITDYSPELAAYNDSLDELINDAYFSLWTTKRWNFGFKEIYLKVIPDLQPGRENPTGADVTANVIKGSRLVDFSSTMDRLNPKDFEGQPIEIQGLEYIISKITSLSQLILDQPFVGTTNAADSTWSIKKRFYDLPQDSIELLSLAHRDVPYTNNGAGQFPPYGKIIGLMPRKDEELNLRMDWAASYAEAYVWSAAQNIQPGEKIGLSITDIEGSTGFPKNTFLEVCWAFEKDGKIGPLSKPEVVSFVGGGNSGSHTLTISFLSWDNQPIVADTFQTFDTKPTQWEGMRKVVFWNANFDRSTGERIGLPVWKHFNVGGATRNSATYLNYVIAEDIAASVTISYFNQIDAGNARYVEYDGQHSRIRPYPRIDAWDFEVSKLSTSGTYATVPLDYIRKLVARYYYKPKALGMPTDSPELPNEFHQLIVYKALQTIYEKLGQVTQSEMYQARFDKEMKGLEKRYVDHIDSVVQRGQFGMFGDRFVYDYQSLRKLS
jgi:hypothetical protein